MTSTRSRTPFLTAEWRNLLMLNWEVEPKLLLPYLPLGTELDEYEGRSYVSIVAFQFLKTRILGLQIPFHSNFEEVNLRFYVKREVDGEVRRGVVFIKEIVPRFWIAAVARILYNEPYRSAPMSHTLTASDIEVSGSYEWSHNGIHHLSFSAPGAEKKLGPGSLEQFIAEHYWGYCSQRDSRVAEYQVAHPSWAIRDQIKVELRWDPRRLYGEIFGEILSMPPQNTFFANGSAVSVFWPARYRMTRAG